MQNMEPRDQIMRNSASEAVDLFSTVLGLVGSVCGSNVFDKETKRALRLACKSTKTAIETFYTRLSCRGRNNKMDFYSTYSTLSEVIASNWDTTGIKDVTIVASYSDTSETQSILDLNLESLEKLTLDNPTSCSRLAHANWPCLKSLSLDFTMLHGDYKEMIRSGNFDEDRQLAQLRNVTWPLRTLDITATEGFEQFDFSPAMEILYAFPGLIKLSIEIGTYQAVSMVQRIVEVPLLHLEELVLDNCECEVSGIPSVLATGNWPKLQTLTLGNIQFGGIDDARLLGSAEWFGKLKSLGLRDSLSLESSVLTALLHGLSKGPLEELYIEREPFATVMAFKDMHFPNLKKLEFIRMATWTMESPAADAVMDCLFSARMPVLEYLAVDLTGESDTEADTWFAPPFYDGHTSFPALKRFELNNLTVSYDLLEYVYALHMDHNWKVNMVGCTAPILPLTDELHAAFEAAKVTEEDFDRVLEQMEMYVECRCWGNIPKNLEDLAVLGTILIVNNGDIRNLFPCYLTGDAMIAQLEKVIGACTAHLQKQFEKNEEANGIA